MGMIVDMILTVTVVSVATGAISELKFRITDIRSATYGTLVRVSGSGFWFRRAGREGDCAGFVHVGFCGFTANFGSQSGWDYVNDSFSEE